MVQEGRLNPHVLIATEAYLAADAVDRLEELYNAEGWTPIGTVRAVGRKKPGVFLNGESAESVVHTVGAEGTGHVHFG